MDDTNYQITSNKKLTKELQKIGITNREFMQLMGYSPNTVKKWKEGKVPVWVTYVVRYLQLTASCSQEVQKIGISSNR